MRQATTSCSTDEKRADGPQLLAVPVVAEIAGAPFVDAVLLS